MHGSVASVDVAMELDRLFEFLQLTLRRSSNLQVPVKMIQKVVGPVVPLDLDTTSANALHMLRSSLPVRLVGPALAGQLSKMVLAEISELPVRLIPEETLKDQIRQDLVASLHQNLGGPEEHEGNLDNNPLNKFKKARSFIAENLAAKTSQVLWMLENRLAINRVTSTASSAMDLLAHLTSGPSDGPDGPCKAIEELQQKESLRKHLLLLDAAVDRHLAEHLWALREAGTLAGVALASDESPPSQPRFRGLRFQITVMYLGSFAPCGSVGTFLGPSDPGEHLLGTLCIALARQVHMSAGSWRSNWPEWA